MKSLIFSILITVIVISCTVQQPVINSSVRKADSLYISKLAKDYFNKACAANDSGNYTVALMNFTNAINDSPNFATAYYLRAIVKIRLEQIDNACIDLNKAGELGYIEAYTLVNKIRRRNAFQQMIVNM